MKKLFLYSLLILSFGSCEILHSNKISMPNEKYKFYDKDFIIPVDFGLKTDGIYIETTIEKFDFRVATYDKYYKKRGGHPALKNFRPTTDTTFYFNKFYYLRFFNNGKCTRDGGTYSKEDLIKKVQPIDATLDYDLYKFSENVVYIESYNPYKKRFTYLQAFLKNDTLYVTGKNNKTFEENKKLSSKYVFEKLKS